MSNTYTDNSDAGQNTYQRGILDTRRSLREALADAQTNHDTHHQPLYQAQISPSALRTHQLVIDLIGEITPRKNEVPSIWRERKIAEYQHPVQRDDAITWQPQAIVGLQAVTNWRNVHLPKPQAHAGDTAASAAIVQSRAYMPVEVMTAARHAIDDALAKLGWLPEGDPGDFAEPEPSI